MPTYHNYSLAPLSWFRAGGSADTFIKADTLQELQEFMHAASPFHILGNGSNTLIRDGGVVEPVLKLGRGFRAIVQNDEAAFPDVTDSSAPRVESVSTGIQEQELGPGSQETLRQQISQVFHTVRENRTITVGAACLNRTVVEQTAAWGLSGLEFLIGIPGSIGGAVAMNAGASGSETKDVLLSIQVCLPGGTLQTLDVADLAMTYRHSILPKGAVVINATFMLKSQNQTTIRQRINSYLEHRDTAQPTGGKTGGSTFKNPEGHKAWELIDRVGLRGYRIGGAAFSEKHCNFIMNTDGTASDIEALGNLAQTKVKEQTGIELEWEIKRLGLPA